MSRRGAQAAAAANLLSRKSYGSEALRKTLWKIGYGKKAEQVQQECFKARKHFKEQLMKTTNGGSEALRKTLWKIGYGKKAEQVQQECFEARKHFKEQFMRLLPAEQGQIGSKISMSSVLVLTGFADLLIKTATNVYMAFRKRKAKDGVEELWTTLSGIDTKEVSEGVKQLHAGVKLILSQNEKRDAKLDIINGKLDRLLAGPSSLPSRSSAPQSTIIAPQLPVDPKNSEEDGSNGEIDGGE